MSDGKKRELFTTPSLSTASDEKSGPKAPEVRIVKSEDVPDGKAAPVPSPLVMFRHAGPALPGARRDVPPKQPSAPPDDGAMPAPAADAAARPETVQTPDTPDDQAAPAKKSPPPHMISESGQDLSNLTREEIREIRKEERRIKRVLEGRSPPQPGDPVPNAPLTVKQQKDAKRKGKKGADVYVPPVAPPAQFRRRHWGVLLSFLLMVALPLGIVAWYLNERAVDQFASTSGFTVRSEETPTGNLLTGLAASLGGGSTQTDTDILYEFIQSQSMVEGILNSFDLHAHYSANYEQDPFYSLHPDATAEDLLDYWSQIVSISYDQSSGLIEMRVQAFDADTAQKIAQAVLKESQALINDLNAQYRADALQYSQQDLDKGRDALRKAREALILFRTRTQIVDPETDLQGRLGVVNSLQAQLAEALIEQDLLREQTSDSDPRFIQVRRKIEVIRERIAEERESVSSGEASTVGEEAYPELLAEYEGLQADRQFAEETYRAALLAYDVALANASRESRYLASYIRPTLPQTAEYPDRILKFGLAALFLMLIWSVVILIYYSIRDSK